MMNSFHALGAWSPESSVLGKQCEPSKQEGGVHENRSSNRIRMAIFRISYILQKIEPKGQIKRGPTYMAPVLQLAVDLQVDE
jgi:hypothetical protein